MRIREGVGGVRIREGERVWGGATSLRQGQSDKRAIERMRAREGETGGAGGGLLAAGEADAAGGGVEGERGFVSQPPCRRGGGRGGWWGRG